MNVNYGNSTLGKLYYNYLNGRVLGNIALSVLMSDSYTVSGHLILDITVRIDPHIPQYNKLASLILHFVISNSYHVLVFLRVLIIKPVAVVFVTLDHTRVVKKVRTNHVLD
ncbi:MAG: hypothetical protein DLM72_11175 [Candidatus Nitrosopolaris wilkensis]|nr:MAG: hypothetical protein DLM72_11175 [Candidatus Nitrosopolaris wilkensis]